MIAPSTMKRPFMDMLDAGAEVHSLIVDSNGAFGTFGLKEDDLVQEYLDATEAPVLPEPLGELGRTRRSAPVDESGPDGRPEATPGYWGPYDPARPCVIPEAKEQLWYPPDLSALLLFMTGLKKASRVVGRIQDAVTEGMMGLSEVLADTLLVQFESLQEEGELHARYTSIYGFVKDSDDPTLRCGSPDLRERCAAMGREP